MSAYLEVKSTIIHAPAASTIGTQHEQRKRQPFETLAEGRCRVAPRDTTSLKERAAEVICPNAIASVQRLIDLASIDRSSLYATHRRLGTIVLLRLARIDPITAKR